MSCGHSLGDHVVRVKDLSEEHIDRILFSVYDMDNILLQVWEAISLTLLLYPNPLSSPPFLSLSYPSLVCQLPLRVIGEGLLIGYIVSVPAECNN